MKLSNKSKRLFITGGVLLVLVFSGLALTPHYTCGCGEIEKGTKLTYIINEVSRKLIGKEFF